MRALTPRSARHQRGSVLMLMPAAILIVIVLGAIAVDLSVVLLGERDAASLATAAANDAATAALDETRFRERGEFRLDEARARQIARSAITGSSTELADLDVDVRVVEVGGEPAVRVTVRGVVEYIFAKALPGVDTTVDVEASATAVARPG